MADWHLWLIAALLLLLLELTSGDFWLTCLAIGAVLAALTALLPVLGLPVQLLVFAGGTLLSFAAVRPALLRLFQIGKDVIRTNIEALPGRSGVVTERIAGGQRAGRALVEGQDWRAVSVDDAPIESGARVMVLQVDGSTLVVEKEG